VPVKRWAGGNDTVRVLRPEHLGRQPGSAWVVTGSLVEQGECLRVVLHPTKVEDDRGAWVGAFRFARSAWPGLADTMAQALPARFPEAATGDSHRGDGSPPPH